MSEAEAQIKELRIKLQEKDAEMQDEKRKSSQLLSKAQALIKELNTALQDREHAIQTKNTEMENEKRRSSQLLVDTQTEIRELKATLQDKEHTILAKEDEIQRNSTQIADLQKKIDSEDRQFTRIQSTAIKSESWNIPRAEIQNISKREIGSGVRTLETLGGPRSTPHPTLNNYIIIIQYLSKSSSRPALVVCVR